MDSCTYETTPNIAVVKYWGKRDNELNLPFNGSVSATMDRTFVTRTTVKFDPALANDSLLLNGSPAKEKELVRAV